MFTLDQVHRLYFETKDAREALAKRHAEEAKPLELKLDALKAWMLQFLNNTRQDSAKTEFGTCFKNTATSVTIDQEQGGWEALLDFVLKPAIARFAEAMEHGKSEAEAAEAARSTPELAFLNRSVNKTAVMELLEARKVLAPGVKLAQVVQVNIRRA